MVALLIILAAVFALFTMAWWMPRSWYRRLLYTGGKPNALWPAPQFPASYK